jgi:phosphate uptake regulator
MRRKLIRQGDRKHGSYTVTLPAVWIKQFGLQAGDELDIDESGSSLLISAKRGPVAPKVIHVDARGFTITQIRRNIAEAYRSGAETIEVEYKNEVLFHSRTQRTTTTKKEIEELVSSELFGMEIEKVTPTLFVIKQFSEALEAEFDSAIRKVFLKLQEQVDFSISALESLKEEELKEVWIHDRGINKFCNFCMRILNKKGYHDIRTQNEMYAGLVQLELIGDSIYMIPMLAAKMKAKSIHQDVFVLLKDLKKAINLSMRYFAERKEEYFTQIMDLREKYYVLERNSFKINGLHSTMVSKVGFCYELLINLRDVIVGLPKP